MSFIMFRIPFDCCVYVPLPPIIISSWATNSHRHRISTNKIVIYTSTYHCPVFNPQIVLLVILLLFGCQVFWLSQCSTSVWLSGFLAVSGFNPQLLLLVIELLRTKEIIKVTEHVTNKCGRGQLTYGMYLTRRDKTCGSKIVNDHHY